MCDDDKRLFGKKVFISGAGSGIGKAIALRCAREGADIAINDLNATAAEETASEVRKLGQQAIVLVADVSESAPVEQMVKDYYAQWKELDILVNNAGIGGSMSRLISMDEAKFDRNWKINTKSVFLMSKYFAAKMKKRDSLENQLRGKIINIASMRGLKGRALFGEYSAAKAAVVSLTETLALELGKFRITANAVCPGLIYTPIYGNTTYDNLSAIGEPICLEYKKVGLPEDVAGAVFFLASSDSDWITGHAIPVSGGQFGLL